MNELPNVPELNWIPREGNPYKLRCLDVRSFTMSMVATPSDKKLSNRFIELRVSNGTQHIGKTPDGAMHIDCQLRYPHGGPSRDGALVRAREMEDKWDIFLFEKHLYFARSWTGVLVYRAAIEFFDTNAIISSIDSVPQNVRGGSWLAICAVDFLVKSHLYRRVAPHTVPPNIPDDDMGIAAFSFQEYGRWASYASFEDTTRIQLTECPQRS